VLALIETKEADASEADAGNVVKYRSRKPRVPGDGYVGLVADVLDQWVRDAGSYVHGLEAWYALELAILNPDTWCVLVLASEFTGLTEDEVLEEMIKRAEKRERERARRKGLDFCDY
jgi:hypothetical protein